MKTGSRMIPCLTAIASLALGAFFLADCGSSSSGGGSASGRSSAGPISSATITAYALNSNGSLGSQLCSTTTASDGSFSLSCTSGSPVEIVTSGSSASWSEESGAGSQTLGQATLHVVLPSLSSGQSIGITPLTEIATQRLNVLLSTSGNTSASLSSAVSSVNGSVSSLFGLSDITQSPPDMTKAAPSNQQQAQHGLVLAALSQFAKDKAGNNSLNMMQALANAFSYNGNLSSGSVGSTQVPIPGNGSSQNLSAVLTGSGTGSFQSLMQTYMSQYQSGAGSSLGYTTSAVPQPTPTAAPPPPSGSPSFNNPTPPGSFSSTTPSSGGQPPAPSPSSSPTPTSSH